MKVFNLPETAESLKSKIIQTVQSFSPSEATDLDRKIYVLSRAIHELSPLMITVEQVEDEYDMEAIQIIHACNSDYSVESLKSAYERIMEQSTGRTFHDKDLGAFYGFVVDIWNLI